jgi:hypothetical protein
MFRTNLSLSLSTPPRSTEWNDESTTPATEFSIDVTAIEWLQFEASLGADQDL